MGSLAIQRWSGERASSLGEIEAAHRGVGGIGPGRRYATAQINHAYAVLLCSHFQGFCRDLHSEATDALVNHANATAFRQMLSAALRQGRKLDAGNPNSGNIGSDFNRFGLVFWDEVRSAHSRGEAWKAGLDHLNLWRNAIAHQDFDPTKLGTSSLRIAQVRNWRRSCSGLARVFDSVIRRHLRSTLGAYPW